MKKEHKQCVAMLTTAEREAQGGLGVRTSPGCYSRRPGQAGSGAGSCILPRKWKKGIGPGGSVRQEKHPAEDEVPERTSLPG